MGKNNLLIGTARGKLGDIVFYRTGGEQRFRTRVRPTNPRSNAQLLQRCVVATVVKAYSPMINVCDHAFQNYNGKLKNQERYMRLNIMKFRPVAVGQVERWDPIKFSANTAYNWAKKDDVNTYVNPYIVSEGDLPSLPLLANSTTIGTRMVPYLEIGDYNVQDVTYQDFCDYFGLTAGDQITILWQNASQETGAVIGTAYSRIILMPETGDMNTKMFTIMGGTGTNYAEINSPNRNNFGKIQIAYVNTDSGGNNTKIAFIPSRDYMDPANLAAEAIITSRFENNTWRRSSSEMVVMPNYRSISMLQDAMASYEKSDTSSLYLNQATTQGQQNLQTLNMENIEANALEDEVLSEEIERKTAKKSRK